MRTCTTRRELADAFEQKVHPRARIKTFAQHLCIFCVGLLFILHGVRVDVVFLLTLAVFDFPLTSQSIVCYGGETHYDLSSDDPVVPA